MPRGTLLERMTVCGKSNCRCAGDPDQRHGPCFRWNRREDGALRHHDVTAQQAADIWTAIATPWTASSVPNAGADHHRTGKAAANDLEI